MANPEYKTEKALLAEILAKLMEISDLLRHCNNDSDGGPQEGAGSTGPQ